VKKTDKKVKEADKIILGMHFSNKCQKIILYVLIVVLALAILLILLAKLGFNWQFGKGNNNIKYGVKQFIGR